MALYKNCNEIWPPYHALQNQPRCNSLTSLPWHYQTQAFVLASVSSICGPSLPGMFFSQISLGHLLHVILVSAQISPQKSLLWSPWLKQPHCSCPISHYPVSFFFHGTSAIGNYFTHPWHEKNKDPEDRDFVLFTPSLETFLTHSRYSQISTGEVTS